MASPDSGLEVVPPPPLSLGEKELESAGCILVSQDKYRKNFSLEVVPAPPLSLGFQISEAADSSVIPLQNYSERRALPRLWKWYGPLCVLFILLFIGAVVGAAVEGTRNRNNVVSSTSTSTHPSTPQSAVATSTSISISSPSSPAKFAAVVQDSYGLGPDTVPSNLLSSNERAFPFDYEHSGKLDHMVIYQPGAGAITILKNNGNGTFASVYSPGAGNGIGNFSLMANGTLGFAFDYEQSGKLDYLVFYVPGSGIACILNNVDGNFSVVYGGDSPADGIGTYDLHSTNDRAFAFDYDHSGRLDHIVLYRPGTGIIMILENVNGTFSPVYKSNYGLGGLGIGGYDLESQADHALAFDYAQSGRMDYIILYRPGTGTISIIEHGAGNNNFTSVYQQGDGGSGIGGFGISSSADLAFAYDYDSTGRQDHLVFYRPGTGIIWILQNNNGTFAPVYGDMDPGEGIGGWPLEFSTDLAFAFDYEQSGNMDYIVLYRPSSGMVSIVGKV